MYVKLDPVQFPYSLQDLRRDNPNTSFPPDPDDQTLAEFGVQRVIETFPPSVDGNTHRIVQSVALIDEEWVQQWETEELPRDQASSNVREQRNQRLADCDWTQLPDAPVNAAAWAVYRQALRNVTSQPGFPWNVEWPSQPS